MKLNSLNIMIVLIAVLGLITACDEDNPQGFSTQPSAIVTLDEVGQDTFDFEEINNGTAVNFTLGVTNATNTTLSGINILVSYKDKEDIALKTVNAKENVVVSINETLLALDVNVDQVKENDVFTYAFVADLSDGSIARSPNRLAVSVE
ncbi:hypothetical protein FNH22_00090 [Fulvivirga sp. M361]|uniref:hypothetical protein n=1 Tax=Fulvivirga sp. M361 TaxID=2594266 RepID=UPI00117BA7FA|nr:hypothetical protein [Fulvivirga sp. M361]TRX62531.1 hypothetical protein FNH22_00090 [Fulvivirga sp. M361]